MPPEKVGPQSRPLRHPQSKADNFAMACDGVMRPGAYGPAKTLSHRWKRRGDMGVFAPMMEGLASGAAGAKTVRVDATCLMAHRKAASLWSCPSSTTRAAANAATGSRSSAVGSGAGAGLLRYTTAAQRSCCPQLLLPQPSCSGCDTRTGPDRRSQAPICDSGGGFHRFRRYSLPSQPLGRTRPLARAM